MSGLKLFALACVLVAVLCVSTTFAQGDGSTPETPEWMCGEVVEGTPISCAERYAATCPDQTVLDAATCSDTTEGACDTAQKPLPCLWMCTPSPIEGSTDPVTAVDCSTLYPAATTCPDMTVVNAAVCKRGEVDCSAEEITEVQSEKLQPCTWMCTPEAAPGATGPATPVNCSKLYTATTCPDMDIVDAAVCKIGAADCSADQITQFQDQKPQPCVWWCTPEAAPGAPGPVSPVECSTLYTGATCADMDIVDDAICKVGTDACSPEQIIAAEAQKPLPCVWMCTPAPAEGASEPTTPVNCNTMYTGATCPDVAIVNAASCKVGQVDCSADQITAAQTQKPELCTYGYMCTPEADSQGDEDFKDFVACDTTQGNFNAWTLTVTQNTAVPPADINTFARYVACVGSINNVPIVIDSAAVSPCQGTKPIETFTATLAAAHQCQKYAAAGTDATFDTCPTVDPATKALSDTDLLAFCSGHYEQIKQKCTQAYTSIEETIDPEIVLSNPVTTCANPTVYNCPVYQTKCVDVWAPETEGEEDTATTPVVDPFNLLHHEPVEVQCAGIVPTCPTCNPHTIPLITSWTDIKPQVQVHCYVKVGETPDKEGEEDTIAHEFQLQHSDDNKYELVTLEPTSAQYQICLRGGNLAQDPSTATYPTCTPLKCAYYECEDPTTSTFSFDACYAQDESPAQCTKSTDFPCAGTFSLNAKCYVDGVEQVQGTEEGAPAANAACIANTSFVQPILSGPCNPTTCPSFVWVTDAVNNDELDTDFGEEETSSEAFIVIDGSKITATLSNLTVDADKTWQLQVLVRTQTEIVAFKSLTDGVVVDTDGADGEKEQEQETPDPTYTYSYSVVEALTKTVSTSTATVTIDPASLPIGTHFVLRAKYGDHVLIQEDGSGDCEILDVAGVYPPNPATCEEDGDKETPKDQDGTASFVVTHEGHDHGASADPVIVSQKIGREKLAVVVTGCRLHFGDVCSNGAYCESVTEGEATTYQCSACPQAFSGDVCATCDLTSQCANGTTPFVDNEATGQCKCTCDKKNSGALCSCAAFYARLNFKGSLVLNAEQTQEQFLALFLTDLAAAVDIDPSAMAYFASQLTGENGNYYTAQISACAITPAQFSLLAAAAAAPTYTSAQVNAKWSTYQTSGTAPAAANQIGGVSSVSALSDPSCTTAGVCPPDVTDPAYTPPTDQTVDPPAKEGGKSNAWWIILIIFLAIIVILVVIVVVRRVIENNRAKSFGADSEEEHLDMAELS